ncbi:fatty acid desaturase family protein [Marinoscillum pacificum]|uniref:fatty acid desaturase family protein n=1 Tax=Marinoscillum pacificum TaxID=392723 RepID=UPI0021573BED|nr:fatty acid desaturase [Marinoscillum pacificum]
MLRYKADIKTLVYLTFTSSLMLVLFFYHEQIQSAILWILYGIELVMAITVGVIVHNHRHVSIWKNKTLNNLTDCWLTVLYGFPVFGWIPTHLQNHHTHTNKEPDYTKTYAFSEKNNLWTIIYYPMYSSGVQLKAIRRYLSDLRTKNREKFIEHIFQIISLVLFVVAAFIIDWKAAILFVIIPQQISLNSVLVFNYVQHIHADEESEYNHSRNIEGPLNTFLFNNGLHTAHHIKPHLHWSRLPEFHAEIRDKIDPKLNEKSLIWYLIRQYLLSPFNSKWSTVSMRLTREKV